MHQLTNISNLDAPKVFGHLYIAIFSNGTVKAGMSGKNPNDRVTSHANAGKAFGISMDSSFCVSIYTDDTKSRERLMHQEISELATLTAGREWFKFDNATMAVNFASAYLCKVERMSFSERPSIEALLAQEKARDGIAQAAHRSLAQTIFTNFQPSLELLVPVGDEELKKMESQLHEYSPSVAISIARKIMDHEDYLAQTNDDLNSGLPLLTEAIDRSWEDSLSALIDPNDFQSRCTAVGSVNFDSALLILKAAANYPNFFNEALSRQEVAA